MKTFYFAALAVCFFVMTGCSDDALILSAKDPDLTASNRSDNNLAITITLTNRNTISFNADKVIAEHVDGDEFLLTADPGKPYEQSYYATAATIYEAENQLKVVIDPGLGQNIYSDRHTLTLTGDEEDGIQVHINQGNISLNATAIVGEDTDGL